MDEITLHGNVSNESLALIEAVLHRERSRLFGTFADRSNSRRSLRDGLSKLEERVKAIEAILQKDQPSA